MRENVFWDRAMCLSALLCESAGSGRVALLLALRCASPLLGTASFGTVKPRQRSPGGDGSAVAQGGSLGAGGAGG